MRIVTWNINGLPSALESGSLDQLLALDLDILCIQETRTQAQPHIWDGYTAIYSNAARKGFWGSCALTREMPTSFSTQLGNEAIDSEGRFICLDFGRFYLASVYAPAPTASGGLRRRAVRQRFDDLLVEKAGELMAAKPLIVCGDMNATISDDDFYAESVHQGEFDEAWVDETRSTLLALEDMGLQDVFRKLQPDATDAYTWWAQRRNRRALNRGWRLDYFLVDERAAPRVASAEILANVRGSDHCPVMIEVAL